MHPFRAVKVHKNLSLESSIRVKSVDSHKDFLFFENFLKKHEFFFKISFFFQIFMLLLMHDNLQQKKLL